MNIKESQGAERGQALVLVMLVLMVVVILGSATVTLTASHRQAAARQRNRLQAYYAADAGVERALVMIRQNPGVVNQIPPGGSLTLISNEPYPEPSAGGSIEKVTVEEIEEESGTVVKITSVGTFNKARETLTVKVRINTSGSPAELLKGVSLLPEDQNSDINLLKHISIIGSQEPKPVIYVNGNLNIGDKSTIENFNIYASGKITINKDAELNNCQITEYHQAIPDFPDLREDWYRQQAEMTGKYFGQDTTFPINDPGKEKGGKSEDTTEYSGIYFVNGNVKISGRYSGQAVIVTSGNIDVTDDLKANTPDEDLLVLISLGGQVNINKKGSDSIIDALIIANGKLFCDNKVVLNGGVLVRLIENTNKLTIYSNPVLIDSHPELIGLAFGGGSGGGPTSIEIESWSEQ